MLLSNYYQIICTCIYVYINIHMLHSYIIWGLCIMIYLALWLSSYMNMGYTLWSIMYILYGPYTTISLLHYINMELTVQSVTLCLVISNIYSVCSSSHFFFSSVILSLSPLLLWYFFHVAILGLVHWWIMTMWPPFHVHFLLFVYWWHLSLPVWL